MQPGEFWNLTGHARTRPSSLVFHELVRGPGDQGGALQSLFPDPSDVIFKSLLRQYLVFPEI